MGLVRKISHLLAAFFNTGADFKRRWRQPAPTPSTANGLQGRWQGEWLSEANGHHGALRCLLDRAEDGGYRATFHAVYGGILRVAYAVSLHGAWEGEKLKLDGEADLGPLAGGVYSYRGAAGAEEFVCSYRCKYDHGTFRMKPAPPLN